MRRIAGGILSVSIAFAACGTASAQQEELVVWWGKSFNKAENDALLEIVARFEKEYGVKVNMSQYATQDMIPKVVSALEAGSPPDVSYVDVYDGQVAGKWAFEGRLADLSDVLVPIKDRFAPGTLEYSYLYNDQTKERAYYSFPIKMQTFHIHYWKDMLEKAGFTEADIPTEWSEYWNFWCDKVQPAYRKASGERAFAVGLPLGANSSDSYQNFFPFFDAYDVKLVDEDGKLLVDDPSVREGMIRALEEHSSIFKRGCVPPSSTNWKDPDNNVAQNNKTTIMTMNGAVSIAVKWLDDYNNTNLPQAERDAALVNYKENIRTTGWPNRPDGKPTVHRVAVKTGLVFEGTKNEELAKKFAEFFIREENLNAYVEGGLGRWFPVTKEGQQSEFWQQDPHRQSVHKQITGDIKPYEFVYNWKFTTLNNENAWAIAMHRVNNDDVSAETAVDELIERIKRTVN